jgi:hypothetical protein
MKFETVAQNKRKSKKKVDLQLPEHIRTNGLRCCYKGKKGDYFSKRSSQLSGEVFSIKRRKLCGKME